MTATLEREREHIRGAQERMREEEGKNAGWSGVVGGVLDKNEFFIILDNERKTNSHFSCAL